MAVADKTGGSGGRVDATLEDAWWSLYDYGANVDPDRRAPFRRLSLPDALRRLSDTDADYLTESVRWRALTELARSDKGGVDKLPDFEKHGPHYQTYLQRLPSKVSLDLVAKGGKEAHEHVAGALLDESVTPKEDVCNVQNVVVNDQDAVFADRRANVAAGAFEHVNAAGDFRYFDLNFAEVLLRSSYRVRAEQRQRDKGER